MVMSACGPLFLGCATASPSPATAPQSVQSTSSAPDTQQKDGTEVAAAKKNMREGLICETYKPTGTMMKREVCRTPEQMKTDREAAETLLRESQRKPSPLL